MSGKDNVPHPTKLREYLFKRIIKDMVNDFFCVVPLSDQSRLSRYHHELVRFLQRTRSEEFAYPLNGAFQNLVGAFTYTIGAREKMMTTLNKVLEVYLDHYKLGSCKYPERYEEILQEFKDQIRKINSRLDILDIQSAFIPTGVTNGQQLDMYAAQALRDFVTRHNITPNMDIQMIYDQYMRGLDTQNLFHIFRLAQLTPCQDLTVLGDCFNLYLSLLKMKCDMLDRSMQTQQQQIFVVNTSQNVHHVDNMPNHAQNQYHYEQNKMAQYQQHQEFENNFHGFEMQEREFLPDVEAEFCTDFDVGNGNELQINGNSEVGDYELEDADNEEQEINQLGEENFLKETVHDDSFEKEFSIQEWNHANKMSDFDEQMILMGKNGELYQASNGNESTADGRESFSSEMYLGEMTPKTMFSEGTGSVNFSMASNMEFNGDYNAQKNYGYANDAVNWDSFEDSVRIGDI